MINFDFKEKCYSCSACAEACPTKAISFDENIHPEIDLQKCINCNRCELKELCVGVHKAEIMLGNETKEVTESERSNIFVARKSIVAKRKIMRGEMFSEENITCKRPGNGISPIHWYEVLGKEAEKDFEIDELISCKGVNREDE